MSTANALRICGKTFRTTKYGSPYTLVCQRPPHPASQNCRDIDNGLWFEPDKAATR